MVQSKLQTFEHVYLDKGRDSDYHLNQMFYHVYYYEVAGIPLAASAVCSRWSEHDPTY